MGAVKLKSAAVFLLSFCALSSINLQDVSAEAYSWKDKDGTTFYGSTPPAGAADVKKLAGKGFSRYSQSKLLKPYAGRSTTPAPAIKPMNERAALSRSLKDDSFSTEVIPPRPKVKPVVDNGLKQSAINIQHDESNRVTACSVTLRNIANVPATAVTVDFEFEDGTLVPAEGPTSIDPGAEVTYKISDTQVPVQIAIDGNGNAPVKPIPKVVVNVG